MDFDIINTKNGQKLLLSELPAWRVVAGRNGSTVYFVQERTEMLPAFFCYSLSLTTINYWNDDLH